jgi:hypothetical protein
MDMRDSTRALRVVVVAGAVIGAIAIPSQALAAGTPPTITAAFTPNLVGVGGFDSAISFTVTDTNSSGTESGIAYTAALPAGLIIDNPNGESGTCGTGSTVTANPGTNTISVTAGTLKGGVTGASSTLCTVSVAVTTNTPGLYTQPAVTVSSSDGSATSAPETLTVAGPPTVTVTSPKNNAKFNYGQNVVVTFTCGEGDFGPGLADCSASDPSGNTVLSGGTLDTKVVGKDQDLAVDGTSNDDLVTEDDITYTVLPNNVFTVTEKSTGKDGVVTLKVKLPGAGKLVIGEKVKGSSFSTYSASIHGTKTVTVKLKPSRSGKGLLSRLAKETKPPKLSGKVSIAYTPTGGKKKTATVGGLALKY